MLTILKNLKCEITVEDAYPNGVPAIPEGWEAVRFVAGSNMNPGESILEVDGSLSSIGVGMELPRYPRIIVRKKKVRRTRWLVEDFYTSTVNPEPGTFISGKFIREVKPLTLLDIAAACRKHLGIYTFTHEYLYFAQELGIDVEDAEEA